MVAETVSATRRCTICAEDRPFPAGFTKRRECVASGGYRRDCKKCCNRRRVERRASNPEVRAKEKKYRSERYEAVGRQYFADWYLANREQRLRQVADWAAQNRPAYRANMRRGQARRRTRKRGAATIAYTIDSLVERDGTACVLCGGEIDFQIGGQAPRAVSIEHLICVSWPDYPGDVPSNVALSHWQCNNRRGARAHPRAAAKRQELLRTVEDEPVI